MLPVFYLFFLHNIVHKTKISMQTSIKIPKIIRQPVSGCDEVESRIAPRLVLNQMSGEKTNIETNPDAVPATLPGRLSSPIIENCIPQIIVEKIPGNIEIIAINIRLSGKPNMLRTWLKPKTTNINVDTARHSAANLNHLIVE